MDNLIQFDTTCRFPLDYWSHPQHLSLRTQSVATQLIAYYLMINPHIKANARYHLPVVLIAKETGTALSDVEEALHILCDLNFCCYDWEKEWVFVPGLIDLYVDVK